MNALFSLLPYILLVITAIMIGVGVILGIKRGFVKSVIRFITTAVAILFSVLVLLLLKVIFGGIITDAIYNAINGADSSSNIVSTILNNETMKEVITKFPFAMIAPFVFVVVFEIMKPLTLILYKIIAKRFNKEINMSEKTSKITGAAITGFQGLLCAMIIIMPIVGVINFAGNAYEGVPEQTAESVSFLSVVELAADTADSPTFKILSALGSDFAFNQVSAVTIEGDRVYPYREIGYVANAVVNLLPLIEDDMGDYSQVHAEGIERFSQSVNKSEVFINAVPEILSDVADDIIKVDENDGNEAKNELLLSINEVLTNNDEKTIKEDIKSVASMFRILINHDFFKAFKETSDSGDNDAILEVIAVQRDDSENEKSMLGELLNVLSQNTRTISVIPDAANLGLWYLCDIMQIQENYETSRETLLQSLTDIINDNNEETKDTLAKKIKAEFSKHGLFLDISTATALSKALDSSFNIASVDKLTESLMVVTRETYDHRVNQNNITGYQHAVDLNIKLLNMITLLESGGEVQDDFIIEAGLTDETLKKSFDSIEALAYGTTFEDVSKAYTYGDVKIDKDTLEDISDADMVGEGNLIAGVVYNALKFKNSIPEDNSDVAMMAKQSDFRSLGLVFDDLDDSLLFGGSVRKLLIASLRSSLLQGLDILTDSMIETIEENENLSAVKLFSSVKDTIILVNTLGKEDASDDEVKDTMKTLVENIDSTTAGILSEMINKDTVKSYGVSDDSAVPMSNLLKNIMTDFGNAEGLGEEEYQNEVKAMQYLYKAADSKSSEGEGPKPMFGENGKYSSSDDFVETIMSSSIMLNSANATSYDADGKPVDDPLNVKDKMSEDDSESLSTSISDYYNNNKTDDQASNEKLKKDLVAVGVLLNVDVSENLK